MKRKRIGSIRISSWNVAGLNACLKKGFADYVATEAADILMIQETKLSSDINIPINYKFKYYNHCTSKKGYSGVAVFSNLEPINVSYSIGHLDKEGRYIILEFQSFILINAYVPNASEGLKRLSEKREHVNVLQEFMKNLKKPIVWGGDLNVAHTENDLARPKTNLKYLHIDLELLALLQKSEKTFRV
jgi:exodeoxyribonuclease III